MEWPDNAPRAKVTDVRRAISQTNHWRHAIAMVFHSTSAHLRTKMKASCSYDGSAIAQLNHFHSNAFVFFTRAAEAGGLSLRPLLDWFPNPAAESDKGFGFRLSIQRTPMKHILDSRQFFR